MAKLLPFPAPAAGELEERLATDQAANHRTATQLTASWGAQPAWAAAPRQGAWPGCQASRTGSSPAWCCLAALFCCSGSVPLLQGCSFCATSAQRSTHFPGSSRASCRAPAYLPACSACCVCPSTQAAAVAGPPPAPSPGHASCGGRRPQPWRKTLLSSSGSGPRSRARVSWQPGGWAGSLPPCTLLQFKLSCHFLALCYIAMQRNPQGPACPRRQGGASAASTSPPPASGMPAPLPSPNSFPRR